MVALTRVETVYGSGQPMMTTSGLATSRHGWPVDPVAVGLPFGGPVVVLLVGGRSDERNDSKWTAMASAAISRRRAPKPR